jgi:hypothetical protein
MKTGYNNLKIIAYSSGSTIVPLSGLERAQNLTFRTFYPGGIYADCTFFVPMDVIASLTSWQVRIGQRLKIYNGLTSVYEGRIITISPTFAAGAEGANITVIGYWGDALQTEMILKPWADTRLSEDIWPWDTTRAGAPKCDYDRDNRLYLQPKADSWATNQVARFVYTAPTGQTIKRVTFGYDLQEAAQNWSITLVDVTNVVTEWTASASGTGTRDETIDNPNTCRQIAFNLLSGTIQTPADDGTQYGKFTDVVVYTETGTITLTEIAKDVRALASDLSANESYIGSNGYSLVPFVIDPPQYLSDVLMKAASYGDGTYNAWACCIKNSDYSGDDKPVLAIEQQPALTDYEYQIRLDAPNVESGISFSQDLTDVVNDVIVQYQDPNGGSVYITSADDSTLQDAASVASYGLRQTVISLFTESALTAANFGRSYLAKYSEPQWRASGDLIVRGYIMGKNGNRVPASEIQAGQRVIILNFLNDLNGTGLTFLITMTNYSDAAETCALSLGKPDNLDVILARMETGVHSW